MEKRKITKEDIFYGNYIQQTPISAKKHRRFTTLLLSYGKWILGVVIIITLYQGYWAYRDLKTTQLITEEYLDGNGGIKTQKVIEVWNGAKFSVIDKYKETGKIIGGTYSYWSRTNSEALDLVIKDNDNQNICITLIGTTKSVRNKLNRMIKEEEGILKEKYLNKTATINGYLSAPNNVDDSAPKPIFYYNGYPIECDVSIGILVNKIEIKS